MTLTLYDLEICHYHRRILLSDIQSCSMLHAVEFETICAMLYRYFQDDSFFHSFYGGHLGNDVIKKMANVIGFQKLSKCLTRTLY